MYTHKIDFDFPIYFTQAVVSFKKYMPPPLPYEEGAYIFFCMKQVPVIFQLKINLKNEQSCLSYVSIKTTYINIMSK
jgi:hypothetical protein